MLLASKVRLKGDPCDANATPDLHMQHFMHESVRCRSRDLQVRRDVGRGQITGLARRLDLGRHRGGRSSMLEKRAIAALLRVRTSVAVFRHPIWTARDSETSPADLANSSLM